jgi:hypothetical protein
MRGKYIVAGTAAALLLPAVAVDARTTISNFGACAANTLLSPGATYAQTFMPTFSGLKSVRLVLFESDPPYDDVVFQVILKDQDGVTVGVSDYGVLAAGTSYDDAVTGQTVTFTFRGVEKVVSGQAYELELLKISGTSAVRACVSADTYADGYLLYNGAPNLGWDFEFGAAGVGPPK